MGAARLGVARTKHKQTPLGGPGGRPWLAPQAGPRKTSLTSSKTTVKDKVVHSMCMGLVVGVLWLGGTPSSFAKTAPPHVLPPFSLVSPIPEPARLFEVASLFSSRPDGDPIEPFVIMGTNMKKSIISVPYRTADMLSCTRSCLISRLPKSLTVAILHVTWNYQCAFETSL